MKSSTFSPASGRCPRAGSSEPGVAASATMAGRRAAAPASTSDVCSTEARRAAEGRWRGGAEAAERSREAHGRDGGVRISPGAGAGVGHVPGVDLDVLPVVAGRELGQPDQLGRRGQRREQELAFERRRQQLGLRLRGQERRHEPLEALPLRDRHLAAPQLHAEVDPVRLRSAALQAPSSCIHSKSRRPKGPSEAPNSNVSDTWPSRQAQTSLTRMIPARAPPPARAPVWPRPAMPARTPGPRPSSRSGQRRRRAGPDRSGSAPPTPPARRRPRRRRPGGTPAGGADAERGTVVVPGQHLLAAGRVHREVRRRPGGLGPVRPESGDRDVDEGGVQPGDGRRSRP